jgi:hypothetical protein
LASGGVAIALLALGLQLAGQRHRNRAYDWLTAAGVSDDAAALEREDDPQLIDLRLARTVLANELAPKPGVEHDPRAAVERLAEAMARSRGVLVHRPASWEGAFVLGASTYLARALGRDPRLFLSYRDWEAPLELSSRLAPGRRNAERMLASIYLEIWPSLSARKRTIARQLLSETFHEPRDLERLLPAWLRVAEDRQEAFSVVPNEPAAWEKVQAILGTQGDLEGFRDARGRWNESLLSALRRDLREADRARAAGNVEGARNLYLSVATRARPESRYLDVVAQALDRCPPGPVDNATTEKLAPHLTRALDRCLAAGCEMEPTTLKRLASLVRDRTPQLAALAALFAGDLTQADLIERRSSGLWSEEWAPYLIAKARILAARGEVENARAALALVHRDWQGRPLYWQAMAEVATAARDERHAAVAREALARLGRSAWGAGDWSWRKEVARLEMVAGAPAQGLAVTFVEVPAAGAVVELRLDGADLGGFALSNGSAAVPLRVATPVRPGLHVLEMVSTHGGQVLPGTVQIF